MEILGIDIGGSGIKGAPVNVVNGELVAERFRLPTPIPAEPDAVAETVAEITRHFDWKGRVGCGFPSVVQEGVTLTAANISDQWVSKNAAELFSQVTGLPVFVINDADAAGIAEMTFGAGRDRKGVVLLITIGTGLGSALFVDGHLLPNTEFGHMEIRGKDAEARASDAVRKEKDWSWKKWSKRFNEYLMRMEALLWPDLIILGGGGSKDFEKFSSYLTVSAEVVPAQFLNEAGIVGAALAAGLYLD